MIPVTEFRRPSIRIPTSRTFRSAASSITGSRPRPPTTSSTTCGARPARTSPDPTTSRSDIRLRIRSSTLASGRATTISRIVLRWISLPTRRADDAVPAEQSHRLSRDLCAGSVDAEAVDAAGGAALRACVQLRAWRWRERGASEPVQHGRSRVPAFDRCDGPERMSPRFGLAYNIFGTGKTSVKMNLSHYLQSASNDGIYTSSNPAFSYQYTTTRTWLDFNGNKTPDCDLNNPAEQIGADLCSAIANSNFGKTSVPRPLIRSCSAAGRPGHTTGSLASRCSRKYCRGSRSRSRTTAERGATSWSRTTWRSDRRTSRRRRSPRRPMRSCPTGAASRCHSGCRRRPTSVRRTTTRRSLTTTGTGRTTGTAWISTSTPAWPTASRSRVAPTRDAAYETTARFSRSFPRSRPCRPSGRPRT